MKACIFEAIYWSKIFYAIGRKNNNSIDDMRIFDRITHHYLHILLSTGSYYHGDLVSGLSTQLVRAIASSVTSERVIFETSHVAFQQITLKREKFLHPMPMLVMTELLIKSIDPIASYSLTSLYLYLMQPVPNREADVRMSIL